MNGKDSWRSRCLSELQEISIHLSARIPGDIVPKIPSSSGKVLKEPPLDQVFRLLGVVVSRTSDLRAEILDQIPADRLQAALAETAHSSDMKIRGCLRVIHTVVGRLAILTRALDRLRDELVDCDDSEWLKMQVEFCFDGNVEPISVGKNVPARQFLKEASDAYEERFSNDLVDYKKTVTAIGKVSTLTAEEIGRILEGLILSIRELDRDIGIHLAVIGEWIERSMASQATIRSVFCSEPLPVTGDGLTQETAWEFPLARMQGEGVAMAHEFMASKGPLYDLRKQALVELDDEKVVEYWETAAGRFWFHYRKDPWINLMGE